MKKRVVIDPNDGVTADEVSEAGRVLAEGNYAEVSANPEVKAAYLGTDPALQAEGQHG